jgi:hypothetical protein
MFVDGDLEPNGTGRIAVGNQSAGRMIIIN